MKMQIGIGKNHPVYGGNGLEINGDSPDFKKGFKIGKIKVYPAKNSNLFLWVRI